MSTRVQKNFEELYLFGGPLKWLGRRLWLVWDINTFKLGLFLGLFAWGVLVILALIQGIAPNLFSLAVVGIHVRLLLAIPLFFLCETRVAPRMNEFIRYITKSGIVPEKDRAALNSRIRLSNRSSSSWLAEAILLLLAILLPFGIPIDELTGRSASWSSIFPQTEILGDLTYIWYEWFCFPLFRFLLLRWLWHLGLWWFFLWRMQSLRLHLIPTHPDRSAGLGYLEVVHLHFNTFILAISAIMSATYAGEIYMGTMAFETIYRLILVVLLLIGALFIGPLFLFSLKLRKCRFTGLNEYMSLAFHYVNAFDRKWVRNEMIPEESLLGTSDIQSLADIMNSIDVIQSMRIIPVGRGYLAKVALVAGAPFLPLFLFKYRLDELALRLVGMLAGL